MRQYIVDAFTDRVFTGNPAAVCLPDRPLPDEIMLKIAAENRLSETAFLVKEGNHWRLRWFTPAAEIDLCGHATLATAFVVLTFLTPEAESVAFESLSGTLTVRREGRTYWMDFPAYGLQEVPVTEAMADALGVRPVQALMGRDLVCVLDREEAVRRLRPDLAKISALEGLLLHVTAPGRTYDAVSRSFGPKIGIDEDPVCGSGHCHIFPYWAAKLGKTTLSGHQASARGGDLEGRLSDGRVTLGGRAVLFSQGEIFLPEMD